jgi:transposase InsO family protein
MSGRDPLASPAPGVLGGSRQRSVAAHMATASQGTPPTQPRVSLSIKDAKFDTPLTPATATVWFRRVLVACETLLCETALTDASAPDHAQRQAKFILTANLPDDESYLLDLHTTAKELWDKLQADYAGTSFIRKAELYQRITHELPPRNETLHAYLTRSLQLRADARSAGVTDDDLMSACFLVALRETERFHDWAIQQLQHDPPSKLPALVSSLRTTFRNLLDETIVGVQPTAHMSRNLANKNHCDFCGKQGHFILNCRSLRHQQSQYDSNQSGGPNSRHSAGGTTRHGSNRTRHASVGNRQNRAHQARAFIAIAFTAAASSTKTDTWLTDTCATHHMVNDRAYFQTFTPTSERCHFADTSVNVAVEGTGTVLLQTSEGTVQPLKNVLYVPTFSVNLISLPQAADKNFHGTWGKEGLTVQDQSGRVLVRSTLRDGLFHADCTAKRFSRASQSKAAVANLQAAPFAAVVQPDAQLVHRRFGHIGMSTLSKMSRCNVVDQLPCAADFDAVLKQPKVCGACQEGGQKKSSFPRTPFSQRECVPYAKMHVDIAGPRTQSLGGARYFTTLTDEATGFIWSFTHKTKDQSAECIMTKLTVFLADGHRVKAIRTDRDPVYLSRKFQQFLQHHSIEHQPTSGYSPQENGHAESSVNIIKVRQQCLLSDSGLKDHMWAEANLHAAYLQNISSATGETTPWELIKGQKPDASTLRIWGCKAWKLIPPEKRNKSSDTRKSEEVRFVGFAWPNSKAFRVLTTRNTIEITRHLAFDEAAPPACNYRADFSPHVDVEVPASQSLPVQQPGSSQSSASATTPATPPSVAPASSPVAPAAPVPAAATPPVVPAADPSMLSPLLTGEAQAASSIEVPPPAMNFNANPLFDVASAPSTSVGSPIPAQQDGSQIQPTPRRSARTNKGVPASQYDPSMYNKYAQGLPSKSHVTWSEPLAFLL